MREASGGPERWQQVKSVLDGSLGKSPPERRTWLDEACARDEELRRFEDRLEDVPEVRADLLNILGQVYDRLGYDDAAMVEPKRFTGGG